jgi:hypothetical protein
MEFEKGESSGLCRNFWGNPKQWFNLVHISEFAGASASITPTTGAQSNHCSMFDPGIEPSLRKKPAGLVRCLVRFLPEQTKSTGHSLAPALLLLSCLGISEPWGHNGRTCNFHHFSTIFDPYLVASSGLRRPISVMEKLSGSIENVADSQKSDKPYTLGMCLYYLHHLGWHRLLRNLFQAILVQCDNVCS